MSDDTLRPEVAALDADALTRDARAAFDGLAVQPASVAEVRFAAETLAGALRQSADASALVADGSHVGGAGMLSGVVARLRVLADVLDGTRADDVWQRADHRACAAATKLRDALHHARHGDAERSAEVAATVTVADSMALVAALDVEGRQHDDTRKMLVAITAGSAVLRDEVVELRRRIDALTARRNVN